MGGAGKLFRGFAIKVVGAHIAVPFRFQLQDFSATAERVRVASANGREPEPASKSNSGAGWTRFRACRYPCIDFGCEPAASAAGFNRRRERPGFDEFVDCRSGETDPLGHRGEA
jgi:hypothetical protein